MNLSLIILNILVWLGPFLLSLRKGYINTLHPQFILPFFMIYFILNSYIQYMTNWMGDSDVGIVIGKLYLLNGLDLYNFSFDKTLAVCVISGIFFHLGVRLFNNSINKSFNEHFDLNVEKIIHGNKKIFLSISLLFSLILWLPNYYIPNTSHGTFWTYPLALSVCFIPTVLFNINKFFFIIILTISIMVGYSVLKSKAGIVYILLPMIFYYIFFSVNFLKSLIYKKYLRNIFLLFLLLVTTLFVIFFGNEYGKMNARKLFHRDYSFEILAILIESKDKNLITHTNSWIVNEIVEFVPSILYKKKSTDHINPAKRVAKELFPQTAVNRPNTYWAKHLLFPGYYDFGTWGAILTAFFSGALISFLWRLTKLKVKKYNAKWPIFIYLPLPSFGIYFISVGGFSYGVINFVISSFVLYLIFISSRLRLIN